MQGTDEEAPGRRRPIRSLHLPQMRVSAYDQAGPEAAPGQTLAGHGTRPTTERTASLRLAITVPLGLSAANLKQLSSRPLPSLPGFR